MSQNLLLRRLSIKLFRHRSGCYGTDNGFKETIVYREKTEYCFARITYHSYAQSKGSVACVVLTAKLFRKVIDRSFWQNVYFTYISLLLLFWLKPCCSLIQQKREAHCSGRDLIKSCIHLPVRQTIVSSSVVKSAVSAPSGIVLLQLKQIS